MAAGMIAKRIKRSTALSGVDFAGVIEFVGRQPLQLRLMAGRQIY